MSPVHIHLMLTRAPLFGSIGSLLLLLVGIWRRSDELKRVAFGLLALVTVLLTAWTADLGGKVRHTELGGGAAMSTATAQPEEEHEKH